VDTALGMPEGIPCYEASLGGVLKVGGGSSFRLTVVTRELSSFARRTAEGGRRHIRLSHSADGRGQPFPHKAVPTRGSFRREDPNEWLLTYQFAKIATLELVWGLKVKGKGTH
jgi:hypothetical protein